MQECGFSLAHIFPYNNRIYDPVLSQQIPVEENSYSGIFYAVF